MYLYWLPEEGGRSVVASNIAQACRDSGFFYIVGHGVDEELRRRVETKAAGSSPRITK